MSRLTKYMTKRAPNAGVTTAAAEPDPLQPDGRSAYTLLLGVSNMYFADALDRVDPGGSPDDAKSPLCASAAALYGVEYVSQLSCSSATTERTKKLAVITARHVQTMSNNFKCGSDPRRMTFVSEPVSRNPVVCNYKRFFFTHKFAWWM